MTALHPVALRPFAAEVLDGLAQRAVCAQRAAELVQQCILSRQHDSSWPDRLGSHRVAGLKPSVQERAHWDRDAFGPSQLNIIEANRLKI